MARLLVLILWLISCLAMDMFQRGNELYGRGRLDEAGAMIDMTLHHYSLHRICLCCLLEESS